MENPIKNKERHNVQRKAYIKPIVETVPLLPKQTVLGVTCYSSSLSVGPGGACTWAVTCTSY